MFHVKKAGESYAPMFKPGTILWREGSFMKDGSFTPSDSIVFDRTPKGTLMGRMSMHANFMWEPALYGSKWSDGGTVVHGRGVVVFLDNDPPEDWTHAVVTGLTKKLREPSPDDGTMSGAVLARFERPYSQEAYRQFRRRMFHLVSSMLNEYDIEKMIDAALKIWPEGYRIGDRRLVSRYQWDEAKSTHFAHLVIHPEVSTKAS